MVSETRRGYNRRWVENNRDRIRAYRKKTKDHRNARRRELYANDESRRIKAVKDAQEYHKNNPTRKRNNRLMNEYGITLEEYNRLLESQGGGCAICGRKVNIDSKFSLHVDHDHDTGKIRGILCSSCNLGIGKFDHDCSRLKNAIKYLEMDDNG